MFFRSLLVRRQRWMQHAVSKMAPPLRRRRNSSGSGSSSNKRPPLPRLPFTNNNDASSSWRRKQQEKILSASPALRKTAETLVSGGKDNKDDDNRRPVSAATVRHHFYQQLKTIPNLLTLSRMVAAPCISYWIVTHQMEMAGVACLIAGATDVLDGWIAKTWPETQKTALGTYLDPLADKICINTVACSLAFAGVLATPLLALWMTKDVALSVGTYWHVKAQLPHATSVWHVIDPVTVPLQVHPTVTSKVNTGLQFATLAVALYGGPSTLLTTLSWVTGTTTILSVASYLDYGAFRPNQKKKKHETPDNTQEHAQQQQQQEKR